MKKLATGLLAALILLGGIAAAAVGGTPSDPLISKKYVEETFIPKTVKAAEERVRAAGSPILETASSQLKAQGELFLARAGALIGESGYAATFTEQRFKCGDVITMDTGSGILLLAGDACITWQGGGVVDVTQGTDHASGEAMLPRHRYLAAENTLCSVVVTSDTAVLAPQGFYTVDKSAETDYNALAIALKEMGMFKGSDVSYGGGYELERIPTRIEGLILFLRLIGEESEALACTEPCLFVDVPNWCRNYVTYAYQKGYTKGIGADDGALYFAPLKTITAGEYVTFVLRALGYRDDGDSPDFTWQTALTKAVGLGVLTLGEREMLEESEFLRAQVAYVSYYALDARTKTGETLLRRLAAAGILDSSQVQQLRRKVDVTRIS